MVGTYHLRSLLHPFTATTGDQSLPTPLLRPSASLPSSPLPLPSSPPTPPLAFLSLGGRLVQTTENGAIDAADNGVPPHWMVVGSSDVDCVYLIDPYGRYLSTDERVIEILDSSFGRCRAVRMTRRKTAACCWRLHYQPSAVTLHTVDGLTLQGRPSVFDLRSTTLLCRERTHYDSSSALLQLPYGPFSLGSTPLRRAFSRALDGADEVAQTRVRLVTSGQLLTARSDNSVCLRPPSAVRSIAGVRCCTEWTLLRTAEADVVYLRSEDDGLYLTTDHVYLPTIHSVLLAPKCVASRWKLRSGEGEEPGMSSSVWLQHCGTSYWLRAKPHWSSSWTWAKCRKKEAAATAFTLEAVG